MQPKITKLVTEAKELFTSFEVFPNSNLDIADFERLRIKPLFFSIAWKIPSKINLPDINNTTVGHIPALQLADTLIKLGKVVLLHITCVNMTSHAFQFILNKAKDIGIRNIFLLQGDGFETSCAKDFQYASDLVTYVRNNYVDYFCIGVSGDPHCLSNSNNLSNLKTKINAGSDFIITQMVYNASVYVEFEKRIREIGISVPIIAGVYLSNSYQSLLKMESLTGVKIPDITSKASKETENNPSVINKTMFSILESMIKELIINKQTPCGVGIHFFTMNKTSFIIDLINEVLLNHINNK